MKTFTIHTFKNNKKIDEVRFIEEGFSLWAFILNIFWLFFHKLWLHAILLLAVLIMVNEMHSLGIFNDVIKTILDISVFVYIGFAGRDFLRWRLDREGYKFTDVVIAQSIDEAEYKYINSLIKDKTEVIDD